VPDVRARVAAIELLLREGLGRPAVAEEPPVLRILDTADALDAMSWSDMTSLFVGLFVDEIAAVRRAGGDEHLRSRVLALNPEDRKPLRAALADARRRVGDRHVRTAIAPYAEIRSRGDLDFAGASAGWSSGRPAGTWGRARPPPPRTRADDGACDREPTRGSIVRLRECSGRHCDND
jgi:hypothetical protein